MVIAQVHLRIEYTDSSSYISTQVFRNNQSGDGKLRDYCDGSAYKTHILFTNNPHALQIILHFDKLELLGTKASSIHKVGILKCNEYT